MTSVRAGIEAEAFATDLSRAISEGRGSAVDLTERVLGEHLRASVVTSLGPTAVKSAHARVHATYFRERFATLRALAASGYETWYPEVLFSTAPADAMDITDVEFVGLVTEGIHYGGGVVRTFTFRRKPLRTQVNHMLRLNRVVVPGAVFADTIERLVEQPGLARPMIANLRLGGEVHGFRVVAFDDVVTGRRLFCACHRSAHAAMLAESRAGSLGYVAGSWPHRVVALLEPAEYADGLCHLCVAAREDADAARAAYGEGVEGEHGPYVDLLMRRDGMDRRTATAEVKGRLGLARWLREAELHRLVKKLFPEATVMREASPAWLGRQRLDVFLPDVGLAIEHQGQQHYEPVAAFGGEEALRRAQERDRVKRDLCAANGVAMVDVRFDDALTLASLRHRLRRWIPAAGP